MNTDMENAYDSAVKTVRVLALNVEESLDSITFFRDDDMTPNWGDVGSLNSVAEKLEEVLQMLESYERHVTEDGAERVDARRERRVIKGR